MLHPDDRDRAQAVWSRCVATGEPYEAEYRCRRHDGAWRRFLARGRPQRDGRGDILRWIGTATDVEDLRTTEAALAGVQERLRLALDAAQLGAWAWNLPDNALELSDRCRDLYAIPRGEACGYDRLLASLHPDDLAQTERAIARALGGRGDF